MHSKPSKPKYKVMSSEVSYSRVDEPMSIYDFSDIIDTNEESDFQIDHDLYSEEIQKRFLQAPAYVLTTEEASEACSGSNFYKHAAGDTLTVAETARLKLPDGPRGTRKSYRDIELRRAVQYQPREERSAKRSVLKHRSGSFLADQFIVQKPLETEQSTPVEDARASEEKFKARQRGVSLQTLLQTLVPQPGYLPPMGLLFNCLLMIRQYMSTSDLMQHLTTSFLSTHHQTGPQSRKGTVSTPVHVHCTLYIVFFWIRKMPYDFRCSDLMQRTREFFAICIGKYPSCLVEVRLALKTLYMQLKQLECYEAYLENQSRIRSPDVSMTITSVCPDPLILAQQLLVVESDYLSHIGPEEYVQYLNAQKRINLNEAKRAYDSASCETDSKHSTARRKKDVSRKFTFNLEAYIRWVNRLSYYITTEIVRHPKRKTRAAHIEYFIDVAERCVQLNNFNSTMGVISGLDDASVRRLHRTWQRVSTSHQTRFRYFRSLMSVSSNFATYRSAVANVLGKSKQSFYVPFLCVSLKDIYYINEVIPDTIGSDLINLEKVEKMGGLVAELARLGQIAPTYSVRLENVLSFLHATPVFDSATAMQASLSYENDDEP